MTTPLTHATGTPADGQYRLCKCSRCGDESVCTPSNDFYTLGDPPDAGKPLVCTSCFFSLVPGRTN